MLIPWEGNFWKSRRHRKLNKLFTKIKPSEISLLDIQLVRQLPNPSLHGKMCWPVPSCYFTCTFTSIPEGKFNLVWADWLNDWTLISFGNSIALNMPLNLFVNWLPDSVFGLSTSPLQLRHSYQVVISWPCPVNYKTSKKPRKHLHPVLEHFLEAYINMFSFFRTDCQLVSQSKLC